MSTASQQDGSSYISKAAEAKSPREPTRNLSDFRAFLNLLKFNIGIGIVSLPEATKHVGWLTSIVGLGIIAYVSACGIFFALQSHHKLEQMEKDAQDVNDSRVASEEDPLIDHGHPTQSWKDLPDSGCGFFDRIVGKVFGAWPQFVYAGSIVIGQFVTMVIYLIVIITNLQSYCTPGSGANSAVLIGVIIVLGLFTLIPTLKEQAILSAAGLLTYAFLFVGLLVEVIRKAQAGTLPDTSVAKPIDTSMGQWFGVACFAFAGFPLAMVAYEQMSNPRSFNNVIIGVFSTCWVVYSAFALLGYHCYGDSAQSLIYFNFPEGSIFRNGSSGVLACILAFSFLVQAMPVFHCTTRVVEASGLPEKLGVEGLPLPVVRWTILALALVVGHLVPSVKMMMNTVGAISGVVSGFIFPALVYLALSSREEWLERCRCCFVLCIGLIGVFASCSHPRE